MCMEQKLIMWHGIVVPMMICMFVRAYTCACTGTYAVWGKEGDSKTFPYCTEVLSLASLQRVQCIGALVCP